MRHRKYPYHIIITSNGKQLKDIYHSVKEESAFKKFNELIKENHEKIIFPVNVINNHGFKEANYELMIIKLRTKHDPVETLLKDKYGEYITYMTSNPNWSIIAKDIYYKEETFWVYGYHPQLDRKDFKWIFENLIENNCSKYTLKNIVVFKNKLIVNVNDKLDIVFCKTKDDSIRLYNALEEHAAKNKIKYLMWGGNAYTKYQKNYWYKKLMNFTGWSYDKIRRNSLRP